MTWHDTNPTHEHELPPLIKTLYNWSTGSMHWGVTFVLDDHDWELRNVGGYLMDPIYSIKIRWDVEDHICWRPTKSKFLRSNLSICYFLKGTSLISHGKIFGESSFIGNFFLGLLRLRKLLLYIIYQGEGLLLKIEDSRKFVIYFWVCHRYMIADEFV